MNKIIIILFLFYSVILSQNILKIDSLDKKIVDLTFNDKYTEVKQICDSLIISNNKNPKYYFNWFGADALQLHEKINRFPLSGRDSLREILVDKSIDSLEKVLKMLENIPRTPANRFYLASLHGYYSRYAGLNGYWWAAYVNGKKANEMFEKLIEEYPDFYDAYLYPGVFGYYAARLNGFNAFIASILGVSGNRIDGLKYINLALRKGVIVYPQALLMKLEINTVMEDNPYEAIPLFEEFINKYPANKRVINWYGHTLLNLYLTKKTGKKINNDSLKIIDSFVKAKYYFITGKIDSSKKYSLIAFRKPNTWKGIVEHTKYYYVYLAWLTKDKKELRKYKKKLNAYYSSLFSNDIKHETESKYIYLLTVLLANNNYPEFEKEVKHSPKFKSTYFEAEYNLLQGIALFHRGYKKEAIPFFENAEKSPDERKHTIALRYQLDIYMNCQPSYNKKQKLIEKIEDSDFDKLIFRLQDFN